jgi:hypothetical protein
MDKFFARAISGKIDGGGFQFQVEYDSNFERKREENGDAQDTTFLL